MKRRTVLGATGALPWVGCSRHDAPQWDGGWVGASFERGHDRRPRSGPGLQRRVGAIVVGAGIAGLAAARAANRAGLDDVHVFELEDHAGGNSRGHVMGGMDCPLGAHYLPVPGEQATEVAQWLDELGLRRLVQGEAVYDERQLCHSPQERLFIAGQWVEGLLPPPEALPADQRPRTRDEYLRFHSAVETAGRDRAFCVPTARSHLSARTLALDALTFDAWLDENGFTSPALRWYLDYCCRDDYGAGSAFVSAWAGLHYFASRHGFHAPGADATERGAVLTWPQGNAWLAERLVAGLGERLHAGVVAVRVREGRFDASVDVWNVATQTFETWTAGHVVLAVPLFVAKRLFEAPPAALAAAAAALHHAPWLVANVQLREPLIDHGGAAPAWDNVLMDSPTLGYVDAMHQSTRPFPGPTVLTAYWALGGDSSAALVTGRAHLLNQSWKDWANAVIADLARAHPDIHGRVSRIDLMRYGHAMAVPSPGIRMHPAFAALAQGRGRVRFAHSDLSGYSVFEEAFFHGDRTGRAIAGKKPSASPRWSSPAGVKRT